ncbi:fumarylacetoacetate hydrolase family protein [Cryptosporangium phraense]|uniref:Fumarylacetoacetate hydrolase family protein n=1 Tax=Cryptosporangium phraense TaxID=2593070 RepID=A0A545ASD6_9ACTN|nr:fumarylacetoacetate hydrolase family protein [Cryptosporangium phraense]TQS44247.1 fumarylacetoacetate hydrolase family protein [Cryptosporangium phraense]
MRIALFAHPGGRAFGAVEGPAGTDDPEALTIAELEGVPFSGIRYTGERWALADVELLPPILPSKVVGVGRNYAAHASELGNEVPSAPLLFLKPPTSIIGPGAPIRLPIDSKQVEHEAELAIVIGGRGARQVSREDALKSIFGYTCANDVTARDQQRSDVQFTRAKGYDSFCPLGPWIETDFDYADAGVQALVNDVVKQDGRTKDMIFDVPTLVSYVSHVMTLLPGDVILTGTPAGVGPIVAGDAVSVRIEGLGTLTNPVANRA